MSTELQWIDRPTGPGLWLYRKDDNDTPAEIEFYFDGDGELSCDIHAAMAVFNGPAAKPRFAITPPPAT